jgi:type IV secretion system protein VirB9
MKKHALLAAAMALLAPSLAPDLAQAAPTPAAPSAATDKRIRTILYDENAIVRLTGRLGFQTVIEFDPNERIENVSIGDSVGWQVTPNRRATLLFLKPVEPSATNMTVVTTTRRYVFDLKVADPDKPSEPSVYVLRFRYPAPPETPKAAPPPPPPPPPPPILNSRYSRKGSTKIAPTRIWDDGRLTYFEFADQIEPPAIAAIGPDGREGLVNTRTDGRVTIADVVAPAFVLRHGTEKLIVTNDALAPTKGQ